MPLPSSGSISADDLNEELGNSSGTQIDFETAANALLENASRPHSMNEFYDASSGEDFLFSDWNGSVSITEFGLITATVGNAGPVTINTSNFLAVTSATPRSVNVTITVPSEFNGESVTNAGDLLTDNTSTTQPAVGRYLSISADDTSLAGDDTSVSLTVTDTYYNNASQTSWEITTETISDNSLPVVSFLPITGTGTETVNVTVADNPNGSTRSVRFKVTGTVGGKSASVDVSQASYTPAVPPTVSIDSVSPSAPFSYNGVNQVVFTISKTIASSFTAQISPGLDSNGAIFSTSQPSGITRNSSTSISGTNNTFYVQIPARTDTDEDTKTDYLTVNVSANGLSDSDSYNLSQEGYSLPEYTWGGSVSIDRLTGDVVVSNDDSAGTITISPISFNEYVTTSTERTVTIGNIVIPSGYQNAGTAESLDFNPTQQAAPRTLTATPSSTDIGGQTTSIMLDINDVYYTDTSWTLSEDFDNTISSLTFSPSSGTGDSPYTVVSFGSNTSGGTKYGRFTLSGGDSLIEITITQTVYVAPPSIEITSVSPSSPYPYEGQGNIFVNISRSGGTSYSAQITPSISNDANATFPSSQPSGITWNNSTSLTITTGTSFKVDIPSRSDGTTTTYSSNVVANASNSGGSDSDSYTLEQEGLVEWNTSPSSLSFDTLGGSQNITLNSSYSWTASVSGTGFSINTTSGNSGTSTISVTATQKDLGGSGTVTFSTSGQSDIVVSLSQAAAPLEWYYYVNNSSTGETNSTRSISMSYLGGSTSIGVYTYRGTTTQSNEFTLAKDTGGTYFGVGINTSAQNTSASNYTSQNQGASAAELYINFDSNSGNSSERTALVELSIDGYSEVTFTVTQAADPNAGGSGGGGGGQI